MITTEYAFLLRESDGSVSSVAETHLDRSFDWLLTDDRHDRA